MSRTGWAIMLACQLVGCSQRSAPSAELGVAPVSKASAKAAGPERSRAALERERVKTCRVVQTEWLTELVGLDGLQRPVLQRVERRYPGGEKPRLMTRKRRYRADGTVAAMTVHFDGGGEDESLVYRHGSRGELTTIEGTVGEDTVVETFSYEGAFRDSREPVIFFGCSAPSDLNLELEPIWTQNARGFAAVQRPPPELAVFKGKRLSRWVRRDREGSVTEVTQTEERDWDRTLSCQNVGNNIFAYRYRYTPDGKLREVRHWTGEAALTLSEPPYSTVERTYRDERVVRERFLYDNTPIATFDFVYGPSGRLEAARDREHEILFDFDDSGRLRRRTDRKPEEPVEVSSIAYECPR